MEYIQLQNSDLVVSRICMGGCPMGGYGWGDTQEQNFIDAIYAAIDQGVNFFDTADTYGLGQSEITLSKGIGNKRDKLIIESKFGVRISNGKTFYDNSPDYIEKALEGTLKRLKTSYLDIYTIHYRDNETPIDVVVDKLLQLQKQGKIRYIGLSNISETDAEELLPYKGKFVNCQNEFSLACRKNEAGLKYVQENLHVTPMTWGSLGQGILSGKYGRDTVFAGNDRRSRDIYVNFHGEKLEKNLVIVDYLRQIAEKHNKSVAACAIRYILDYLTDSVVLAGIKNPAQLVSNVEAADWHLNQEEMDHLTQLSKM